MSTVLEERPLARAEPATWLPWIAILLGLAALYVPTYIDLAGGLWRDEAYAHGPIILAVFAWLAWRRRAALADGMSERAPVAGALTLAFGLALYLLGRTQALAVFEGASHLPVIAGAVLSQTNTSFLPLLSPGTRLVASQVNATKRPSAEIAGLRLLPGASCPSREIASVP